MFDVFKEVVAELITESVGGLFGFESRTESGGGLFATVINAVRKRTIAKRKGCVV